MALPSILPYAMPTEAELPKNRVSWTPDPKRALLLIHDMQNYFVDAFTAGQSPVDELIINIKRLRSQCAASGIPVVYSAQPGGQTLEQRGLLQDFWGPGINGGPSQKQIIDELAPSDSDIVMTKWRYSAFCKTNFAEILKEHGRDQLIIVGIYAHIGCLVTATEAFMNEIQPFFVADAVADFSREYHEMAIKYAAERSSVTLSTQQVLEALQGAVQPGSAEGAAEPQLTLEVIRGQVAELLQETAANIGDHDNLILDWGLDSVRVMSLLTRWRRAGVETTFVELAEQPTLAGWWERLSARASQVQPNADYFATQRG